MSNGQQSQVSRTMLVLGGVIFGGGFLFLVYLMTQISNNMGAMTGHMREMSEDVHSMRDFVAVMTSEVSKLDNVVMHMDENMNSMNERIALFHRSTSKDMNAMSHSIHTMANTMERLDTKVGAMAVDVNRMSNMMGNMSYDIRRGTESFTSPMDSMENMIR